MSQEIILPDSVVNLLRPRYIFPMANNQAAAYRAALSWYLDHGVDEALECWDAGMLKRSGQDKPSMPEPASSISPPSNIPTFQHSNIPPLGKSGARAESARLAAAANTLEELKAAIGAFDGIAIKNTATNLVFSDGNPKASVMLVGEAPGADEDRIGKPFVGVSGQLLDRILKLIELDRMQDDPARAIYISNILNWRPPGNRTPSPAEIEVSLPFIERHIALIQPKILILCGGVSAKALLASGDSISRLRRTWHSYKPLTPELNSDVSVHALATYHPAYLLRTPSQKKAVWEDMLTLKAKRAELNIT